MPMKRIRAVAPAGVLVCSMACYSPRTVVDDRGPLLAGGIVIAAIGDASFAWLAGGAEIAYVSSVPQFDADPRPELHAVRVADGATRQLDLEGPSFLTGLARSLDGSALYFVAEDRSSGVPRYTLREALAHKTLPVGDLSRSPLAVSSDARRVLYGTAVGQSVLDASGATFTVRCGAFGVLPIFSPSGGSLLCDAGGVPVMVDVAGGSARTMPATNSSSWRAVRWSASGPQAVALVAQVPGGESVHLVDVATGSERVLHQVVVQRDDALLDLAWAAISNDGSRVAFWETACLVSESLLSCSKTASWLKVVSVNSAQVALVASGAEVPGPIVFSDDGTRIAYAFGSALHARALR
jgi:hypothetical protein